MKEGNPLVVVMPLARTASEQASPVFASWTSKVVSGVHGHALLGPQSTPLVVAQSLEHLRHLATRPSATVTVLAYALEKSEFAVLSQALIAALEANGYRPIYPEQLVDGVVLPSPEKVIDAVVCKSQRRKYVGNQVGIDVPDSAKPLIQEIADLGDTVVHLGLNPGLTDGFVSVRHGRGFLITASETNKRDIQPRDIAHVADYVASENRIVWSGARPPSSETPCASLILDAEADIDVVVHFHCKAITYSPKFSSVRTERYAPYGTLAEAQELLKQRAWTGSSLVVMQGHGEFAFAKSPAEMKAFLSHLAGRLSS